MHECLSDEAVLVWVEFLERFGVILGFAGTYCEDDCENGDAS
jgi:hypothetical protein